MSDRQIKEGDVVALTSGGAATTVSEIYEEDGLADCVWFGNDKPKHERFPPTGLKVLGDREMPLYRRCP